MGVVLLPAGLKISVAVFQAKTTLPKIRSPTIIIERISVRDWDRFIRFAPYPFDPSEDTVISDAGTLAESPLLRGHQSRDPADDALTDYELDLLVPGAYLLLFAYGQQPVYEDALPQRLKDAHPKK